MRVIPPLTMYENMLTSSTASEPATGEQVWSSGTSYLKGATVILGSPTSTVTITVSAPGVVSWTAHG